MCSRNDAAQRSIYDKYVLPDRTDSLAVQQADKKSVKPRCLTLVNFQKSNKRDLTDSFKNTEAYKNI